MKSISERGLVLIRKFEGFCATPYICPAGHPTIGYGHVIERNEHFPDTGISETEAQELLARDVAVAENAVNRLVSAALTQQQFDALVSFTFNLGAAALARSTLRKYLQNGQIEAAAGEFTRWVYVNGAPSAGLMRRRLAEKALFETKENA